VEVLLMATVVLSVTGRPARTVVVNVAGPAGAVRARAVDAAVAREPLRLAGVDVPEEVRSTLLDPFDPGADQAPARSLFDIARKRFAEVAYERALDALVDAEAKARRADPTPSLWQLLTEIHVLMGVVDTARGADEQAVADFRVARLLDQKLMLDAAYYPPNVRARFAQAAPAGRSSGEIEIHDPSNATVTIGGQWTCQAPCLRELPEGEHYLALEAPGREPRIERVLVLAGKRSHVSISLARRPVADEARALVASARRRGALEREEARRLAALLGADLVLAVDQKRARAFWVGPVQSGKVPELPDTRFGDGPLDLKALLAALPQDPLEAGGAGAGLGTGQPPPPPPSPKLWYQRWWVWALGGAVAAGATALTIQALSTHNTNYSFPPQ